MQVRDWLELAVKQNASDIFIGAGRHVSFKVGGIITRLGETAIGVSEAEEMVRELYRLAQRLTDHFEANGDDDFPITLAGTARFRVSAYNQRGTFAAVVRVVLFELPEYTDLHIPDEVMRIANEKHGLVLVTGPAGSGKTTTLACVIDAINKARNCHIITLEDPIEYLHRDNKSLVSQREISTDTASYLTALRACLRQAPDIVLLGEMRDHETIKTAMTAAETGHLIISTLHTVGAVNTIDRIVDVFPPEQQQQVRVQLAMLLRTVVSQQLLIKKAGGVTPAFEIMHVNSAIRNLIRESKTHQIDNVIQTASAAGMISMDSFIMNLVQSGEISKETALSQAANPEQMNRFLERMKV
ncbi:MAG: PilT/PilU family type 4a pilus ATPase [Defluviitaleaceae bacterium]|nr:PilT/PilU family type 4a pilus ATPase [Defluviitaleaceae bacterium]